MTGNKFTTYNKKCKFFSLRFRNGKDDKYIKYLAQCDNIVDFVRKAIDKELEK